MAAGSREAERDEGWVLAGQLLPSRAAWGGPEPPQRKAETPPAVAERSPHLGVVGWPGAGRRGGLGEVQPQHPGAAVAAACNCIWPNSSILRVCWGGSAWAGGPASLVLFWGAGSSGLVPQAASDPAFGRGVCGCQHPLVWVGWAVGLGSPWLEGLPKLLPPAAPLGRALLCCRTPRFGLVTLPAVNPGALPHKRWSEGGLFPLPGPARAAGVSAQPDSLGFVFRSLLGPLELSREN